MKRSTPLKRKRATARRRPAVRCSWSTRCKRRPGVVISETERLCRTHAAWVADKLVGDFVKERDRVCRECSAEEALQWCHVITRGARYIRWDTTTGGVGNSIALCRACHYRYTVSPRDWGVWVESHVPGLWTRLIHAEMAGERSGVSVDVANIIREYRQRAAA